MAILVLPQSEDRVIDEVNRTMGSSPKVTQADDPNTDPMRVGGVKLSSLPDPAVGGENGSRERNGFSNGFRSMFTRLQSFRGAMAAPPAITNAVVGEVGKSNAAGKLYAGVMDQLTEYAPNQASYVASYVGNVTPKKVNTPAGGY